MLADSKSMTLTAAQLAASIVLPIVFTSILICSIIAIVVYVFRRKNCSKTATILKLNIKVY